MSAEMLRAICGRRLPMRRGTRASNVIFSDSLGHDYVLRVADIMRTRFPDLRIEARAKDRWLPLRTEGRVVVHLHWIEVVLRKRTKRAAVGSACRMFLELAALRLGGVQVVWTVHNPIGKGHDRLRLDRALRSALVLVGSAFIVLNPGAVNRVANQLLAPVRRRFRRRVHVVPMPMSMRDHGPPTPMSEARSALGIVSPSPVVVYVPGANQPSIAEQLRDRRSRYTLLSIRRADEGAVVRPVGNDLEFIGWLSDEMYGRLVSAGDAVVLAGEGAFGSMSLHSAVELQRPVVGRPCPAIEELVELGGAVAIDELIPNEIWGALGSLTGAVSPFDEFEVRHADEHVASAAAAAYRSAGLCLEVEMDIREVVENG